MITLASRYPGYESGTTVAADIIRWERTIGRYEHRHLAGPERYVTFPTRLRPMSDTTAQYRIRDLILEAYAIHPMREVATDG